MAFTLLNLPELDGGSGSQGGGNGFNGGGTPGTATGSSQVGAGLPLGENGGLFGSNYFLFVPVQDISTKNCYFGFFDINSFDDTRDASTYSWRIEDVSVDRVPTINRVIFTYRDLGLAAITVTLSGVNDNNQVVSTSVQQQLGNVIPTKALLTVFVDIELSAFRPQLSVTRAAGAGPVAIIGVTLRGEVEENQ